ncbi:MAG: hypothetical protein AAB403_00245, partial [Planctomycetota bacterium]
MLDMLNLDLSKEWTNDLDRLRVVLAESASLADSEVHHAWEEEVTYDPDAMLCTLDDREAVGCQEHLRRFTDSWLGAGCDIRTWPLREELEKHLRRRTVRLWRGEDGRVEVSFEVPEPYADDRDTARDR